MPLWQWDAASAAALPAGDASASVISLESYFVTDANGSASSRGASVPVTKQHWIRVGSLVLAAVTSTGNLKVSLLNVLVLRNDPLNATVCQAGKQGALLSMVVPEIA